VTTILPQAEELLSSILKVMPTAYQQETLQSIIAMFLEGQGHSLPHHCLTKSESAISRFFNHYNWSTRSVIRFVRQHILNLILSLFPRGRKPTLQVILDLTTLEKTGKFPELDDLVRVYHSKKGLHIVVMYLVIGNWRFPWGFRVYRGKDTPSPSKLAQKLLRTLPSILVERFQLLVLGDTAFGTTNLISQVRSSEFAHHAVVGISNSRTLQDGRKVTDIKTRGQQVYLKDLDKPVYLSWVWLKRDGKRVIRYVISTKRMKGSTIARWGRRRWQIEGFFKTIKHRFSLHRFGQKTLLGVYRWLILSFISYLLTYWVYLHLGNNDNLDWFYFRQKAVILLLPHILLLSLLKQLDTLRLWLNDQGFDFCLLRCKI